MTAINHVLVPTDGSAGARKAAGFAAILAKALGARVSVLFVQNEDVIISEAWGPGGSMSVDQIRSLLERRARDKELPETMNELQAADVEVSSVVVWGHPAEEVCRFANEQDVDLIVIGSHGRTGLKRALLGSVSHAVANQAPCPVTIVR